MRSEWPRHSVAVAGQHQHALCATLRLLERGNATSANAALRLLRRAPSSMAVGLRVSPPRPEIDLCAQLSPTLTWMLHGSASHIAMPASRYSAPAPHVHARPLR